MRTLMATLALAVGAVACSDAGEELGDQNEEIRSRATDTLSIDTRQIIDPSSSQIFRGVDLSLAGVKGPSQQLYGTFEKSGIAQEPGLETKRFSTPHVSVEKDGNAFRVTFTLDLTHSSFAVDSARSGSTLRTNVHLYGDIVDELIETMTEGGAKIETSPTAAGQAQELSTAHVVCKRGIVAKDDRRARFCTITTP